jgi:type VI protein secretion system component VasK
MPKTPLRPAPEPLEADDVAIVTGGTAVWFAVFLVQLPFHRWFTDRGHGWWLWTPLAGAGLGLFGLWYVRRRRDAVRREREHAEQQAAAGQDPAHGE